MPGRKGGIPLTRGIAAGLPALAAALSLPACGRNAAQPPAAPDSPGREALSAPERQEAESDWGTAQYGTVFIGYPRWWCGAPMAVLSFLGRYDFSGEEAACSAPMGRGLAKSMDDIQPLLPGGARLSETVLDVDEEEAASPQETVLNWLQEMGC